MFSFLQRPTDEGARGGIGLAFTDRQGGFSTSSMGPLNLGRTDSDDPAHVRANFEAVQAELGLGPVITLAQRHTADVVLVDDALLASWQPLGHLGTDGGAAPLRVGDALVTRLPGVALCIRVADCVPVLLADHDAGVIGAAHAGRVGFAAGILPQTVERMRALGATAITAWIGPHVCGSCYEVPQQMCDEVSRDHPVARASTPQGTAALDLGAGCQAQLESLGVDVHRVDPCTVTTPGLHSHRRDGDGAGRLAGIIWRVSSAG